MLKGASKNVIPVKTGIQKPLTSLDSRLRGSEAPRSKLRGISDKAERNSAGARHPPSPKLRRGHLALPPRSKLWGIRAEASDKLIIIRGSLKC